MSDISHPVRLAAAGYYGTSRVGDFVELLKPRVMALVVFTGWVGMLLAPGHLHPLLSGVAVLCIAVGAGASAAINMWYDRDIDALMTRTAGRPIPSGRVDADEALAFGVFLSGVSVAVMGLAVNWLAAFLLAFTIGFYVFVYTLWLKRRSPQNIVIGGAAGALPPVIGWACVTGSVDVPPLMLFLLIFLWTPPHFWALALFRAGDYARAGVPMLPVAPAPYWLGVAGPSYGVVALLLSGLFVAAAVNVLRAADDDHKPAKRMFGFSILYLFLLFAWLLGERLAQGLTVTGGLF